MSCGLPDEEPITRSRRPLNKIMVKEASDSVFCHKLLNVIAENYVCKFHNV